MARTWSPLAEKICEWPDDKLQQLEVARQTIRNLCLHLGVSEETQALGVLWVDITRAQLEEQNLFPADVDISAMKVSLKKLADISTFDNFEKSTLQPFRKELKKSLVILEEIKDYNEDLVKAACDILSEVRNFIDDSVLHGTN